MIRQGEIRHIESIEQLFAACVKDMLARQVLQWDTSYPTRKNFEEDIANGSLYCVEKQGVVQGVITLNEVQDPQYKNLDWQYIGTKILVVHRLAVHPNFQGQGIALKLMQFAEQYATKNRYIAIRLDAFEGNPRSQFFYRKLGYEAIGKVQFDQPLPCTAFEKNIIRENE